MSRGSINNIRNLREEMSDRMRGAPKPAKSSGNSVIDILRSKEFQAELQSCVPKGLDNFSVERLVRLVQTQLRSDFKLAGADPFSILGAVLRCAELGLVPGYMGHAYLTARLDARSGGEGKYEAVLIPGYRGLMSLAMRSGKVLSITARVVTDREVEAGLFDLYFMGDHDFISHRPILIGDPGLPALVYCLVRFTNGTFHVERMNESEMQAIKSRALMGWDSLTNGQSAWITDETEMWRKTVIRRAIKGIDVSPEGLSDALDLDNKAGKGESQGLGGRYCAEAADESSAPVATDEDVAVSASGDAGAKGESTAVNPQVDPDSPDAGVGGHNI
jgi:recombination protein RecT